MGRSRPWLLIALLAGCAAPPPPPPPTVVTATVTAEAGANDGAPVAVRLYQLAAPAGFEAAGFFPLFNGDAAVLKDDLVRRDDVLLAPGASRTLTLNPPDRAAAIGVLVAFRDHEPRTWRAVVPVPRNASSTLTATVAPAGVTVRIAPAQP